MLAAPLAIVVIGLIFAILGVVALLGAAWLFVAITR